MKNSDIVKYINSGKMPDIEKVRENCLKQTADEMTVKETVQKKRPGFKYTKILATVAALVLVIGLFNIQTVIAAFSVVIEETSKFIEQTFTSSSYSITINTSPGNNGKFTGGGEKLTYNLNTIQKYDVIIQIRRIGEKGEKEGRIEIATNDSVHLNKKNITINGSTIIDMDGNIIEIGTGSCTITKSDGTVVEVNPLLPHQDDSMNELARTEYAESGISKNLIEMLPYMSQDLIDEIAQNEFEKSGIKALSDKILPYTSQNVLEDIAQKEYEMNGLNGIKRIARIISENLLDEFALKENEKDGFNSIPDDILALIGKSAIDEIVLKEYDKNRFKNIDFNIYPFISTSVIDELVKKEYEKSGFKNLDFMMYCYISTSIIDELVKTEYDKNGFRNLDFMMYDYISTSVIDELVKIEYEKNGLKKIDILMYYYISENIIDGFAMIEYEKNGIENLENIAPYISDSCVEEIKQKEYQKTGEYPQINDDVGRTFDLTDNVRTIIETPFIGEIRYITVEDKEKTREVITKIGKDGEFAEVYTKNEGKSNATATVTVMDGDKTVVVNKDADGVITVTVEQNGNIETTEINPEINSSMTFELNNKTVEVSQASKGGTVYITVTRGDVTARIKITKKAEINVYNYLLTTPLYGN